MLTVARLDERKGHLATLAALAKLPAAERASIKYVCVGRAVDVAYEARIVEMASALGVQTVLTGTLPDGELKAAYRTASMLALCGQDIPQKVEGFGLVLLEGAAQGLPAVVTNVHALPEVVVNGFTGWVCEGNDPSRLSTAMSVALAGSTSSDMRDACVSHARKFTWDRCAELTYSGGSRLSRDRKCVSPSSTRTTTQMSMAALSAHCASLRKRLLRAVTCARCLRPVRFASRRN